MFFLKMSSNSYFFMNQSLTFQRIYLLKDCRKCWLNFHTLISREFHTNSIIMSGIGEWHTAFGVSSHARPAQQEKISFLLSERLILWKFWVSGVWKRPTVWWFSWLLWNFGFRCLEKLGCIYQHNQVFDSNQILFVWELTMMMIVMMMVLDFLRIPLHSSSC